MPTDRKRGCALSVGTDLPAEFEPGGTASLYSYVRFRTDEGKVEVVESLCVIGGDTDSYIVPGQRMALLYLYANTKRARNIALAAAVAYRQRLGLTRQLMLAAARAGVQLVAVGAVLGLIFAHCGLAGGFGWVIVMVPLPAEPLPTTSLMA